jgi:sulfite exporter TauE/SafE
VTYAVALMGGLVGSLHCFGMCGGFPVALARARGGVAPQLLYNLGRLNSLLFVGAASGALGAALVASGPTLPLQRLLSALAGAWIALLGLERLGGIGPLGSGIGGTIARGLGRPLRAAMALRSAAAPLLVGLMNELLPCHLVYAFAAQAAASGSAAGGMAIMAAFALGTVPAMLGIGIGVARLAPRLRQGAERGVALLLLAYGVALVANALTAPAVHRH